MIPHKLIGQRNGIPSPRTHHIATKAGPQVPSNTLDTSGHPWSLQTGGCLRWHEPSLRRLLVLAGSTGSDHSLGGPLFTGHCWYLTRLCWFHIPGCPGSHFHRLVISSFPTMSCLPPPPSFRSLPPTTVTFPTVAFFPLLFFMECLTFKQWSRHVQLDQCHLATRQGQSLVLREYWVPHSQQLSPPRPLVWLRDVLIFFRSYPPLPWLWIFFLGGRAALSA